MITNNGTAPISVIEYDSTHQPVAFHLIEAGGSQTFTRDSDGYNYRTTAYVVQGERNAAGQPVLAGIITAVSSGGDTWLDGADGTDFPTNESPWVQIAQTGTTTGVLYGLDPDADVITYSVSTEPEHGTVTLAPYLGGNFAGTTLYVYTYTPSAEAAHAAAAGGATQDFFEVSYTDGYGQAQTIRVDVGIVGQNAGPAGPSAVSGGETGSLGVTDPDGDTLTYEVTTQPGSGGAVVDSSGTYTYIPATAPVHGETLQDSFEVTVRDGHGGVLVVPVSVSITANQAPTVTEVVQDGYTGTIVAADADDDELQFDVTSDPTHGKVVVGPDGSFVYTPDAGVEHAAAGGGVTSDSFVVTVSDGHGGLTPVTVNVGIDPANESPTVATSQGAPSAETGAVVVSVVTADADADAVTVTTTDPAHGTLTDNGDGTLTYTPDPVKRAAGDFTDSFTVTVDDGHGGTATKTVTVTVTKPVVVEPEQPTRSVFDQLVSAIRSGFSSVSSAVSQAWQSFLTWLQSLFANNNTTRV
ncbi:Ig-like domain-containing protein [Gordonia desulfuricans]|uniref:Ig-like domain-containing protein n=1 Tax=Gordonia desulfuricans TaxID=89051 RepID=UPI0027D89D29|nr:Ig-like domain-containing protein [Gordonia desulfuricans]